MLFRSRQVDPALPVDLRPGEDNRLAVGAPGRVALDVSRLRGLPQRVGSGAGLPARTPLRNGSARRPAEDRPDPIWQEDQEDLTQVEQKVRLSHNLLTLVTDKRGPRFGEISRKEKAPPKAGFVLVTPTRFELVLPA